MSTVLVLVGGSVSAVLIGAACVYAIGRRETLATEEIGQVRLYSQACAAVLDGLWLTYPLARLSMYESFLVVSCFAKKVPVNYASIYKMHVSWIFLFPTVLIRYASGDAKHEARVWTFHGRQILDLVARQREGSSTTDRA